MECIISVISWRRIKEETGGAETVYKSADTNSEVFQYLSGDAAVLVEVVQIKDPVEFVSDGASQDDGQTQDQVLQQGK